MKNRPYIIAFISISLVLDLILAVLLMALINKFVPVPPGLASLVEGIIIYLFLISSSSFFAVNYFKIESKNFSRMEVASYKYISLTAIILLIVPALFIHLKGDILFLGGAIFSLGLLLWIFCIFYFGGKRQISTDEIALYPLQFISDRNQILLLIKKRTKSKMYINIFISCIIVILNIYINFLSWYEIIFYISFVFVAQESYNNQQKKYLFSLNLSQDKNDL